MLKLSLEPEIDQILTHIVRIHANYFCRSKKNAINWPILGRFDKL